MSELVAMTKKVPLKLLPLLKILGEGLFLYMSTFPSKPNLCNMHLFKVQVKKQSITQLVKRESKRNYQSK